MKNIKFLAVFLLLNNLILIGGHSQSISLDTLLIYQNGTFEDINNDLILKKWVMGNSDSNKIYWNHYDSQNRYTKRIDGKLKIILDSNRDNSIIYTTNDKTFLKLKNRAKSKGFVFVENEFSEGNVNSIYQKGGLFIKFFNHPKEGGDDYKVTYQYLTAIYSKGRNIDCLLKSELSEIQTEGSSNVVNNSDVFGSEPEEVLERIDETIYLTPEGSNERIEEGGVGVPGGANDDNGNDNFESKYFIWPSIEFNNCGVIRVSSVKLKFTIDLEGRATRFSWESGYLLNGEQKRCIENRIRAEKFQPKNSKDIIEEESVFVIIKFKR